MLCGEYDFTNAIKTSYAYKGVISTEVNITHYDNNDILVTNYNIYHDAPEDKTEEIPSYDDNEEILSSHDEENIGCQIGERPDYNEQDLFGNKIEP